MVFPQSVEVRNSWFGSGSQLNSIDKIIDPPTDWSLPFIQALQGVRHFDFVTSQVTIASTLRSTNHTTGVHVGESIPS